MSKDGNPAFHVLIPAAGNGTRTGLSLPKQYTKIGGKMILRHTIEKFLGIRGLKSLRVIIGPDHAELYSEAVHGLDLPPPVLGGTTRKQSVYNGLNALRADWNGVFYHDAPYPFSDYIMIHDAARPFVTRKAIQELLDATKKHDAATLVAPIADTVIDMMHNPVDRKQIQTVQTPQIFQESVLFNAHDRFEDDETFTDDSGLVAALGTHVEHVQSHAGNFKITTAEDLLMAERIINANTETRTGFGFDVHAFDPAHATHIRLGGIDIAHPQKLLGHSDADVILHALTDALLGTIGEGDIGQLFPPSDMQWKGADSEIFVKEAVKRVNAKGGKIINADITVIAEVPKIGPHREAIINRLSEMLGITTDRVAVKATTSEGLGFTGRKEGIVAQAVVNVSLPS